MDGACSMNGERSDAYRILVGKSKRKSILWKPIRRWLCRTILKLIQKVRLESWTCSGCELMTVFVNAIMKFAFRKM